MQACCGMFVRFQLHISFRFYIKPRIPPCLSCSNCCRALEHVCMRSSVCVHIMFTLLNILEVFSVEWTSKWLGCLWRRSNLNEVFFAPFVFTSLARICDMLECVRLRSAIQHIVHAEIISLALQCCYTSFLTCVAANICVWNSGFL